MAACPDCSPLQINVAESYEQMSRNAEQLIFAELKKKPSLILCASAGGTPTRLYQLLANRRANRPKLFQKMRVLQIDEWGGLPRGHTASCESDLRLKLLEPLGIATDRYVGIRTDAHDAQSECARIRAWLRDNGPIGVCVLGLGLNGHIAMNEPGPALNPLAHVSTLSRSSLNHPMLRQLGKKPRYGLTLGMSEILSSQLILLMVNGSRKRAAFKRLIQPRITTQFPASFVWTHGRARVLCDREVADHSN
ncbi:MAG TPA: 6-phosphogluconolactonase [Patescibacteria group bacterium]|nr:6-phosphogluconolactonase [Patescibacteria group bacterium]